MDNADIEKLLVIAHSKILLSDEGKRRMAEGIGQALAFDE